MDKKNLTEKEYYDYYRKKWGKLARWVLPAYFFGEDIPASPNYLVMNHYSMFDAVIAYIYLDGFKRFIAKKEAKHQAIFGKILSRIGAVFIDRQSAFDMLSLKTILRANKNGENILIYPEGTRNRTKSMEVQDIKEGTALFALKSFTPIVPIITLKKQRPFSRNYVYIGKPMSLDEYRDRKIDGEVISEVTEKIQSLMRSTRQKLVEFLNNGGKKIVKDAYRAQRKIHNGTDFVIRIGDLK
jgi:1-acyl-sn-glycerol-3-phosphate acyltransferase